MDVPQTNGYSEQASRQIDDVLEIGESQQSQSGAQQEVDLDSPLFVPADSPSPLQLPEQPIATVHVPAPPASYQAGAYEVVSSSQPAPSTAPLERHSLEPSQFLPDPVDTSNANEDRTELSLPPTTSSEKTRSVPVNFGQRSAKIVPDSQTLLGSSSFVPSAIADDFSLAPETATSTADDFEGPSESTNNGQVEAPASAEGLELRLAQEPAQGHLAETASVSQLSLGGEPPASTSVQPDVSRQSQVLAVAGAEAEEITQPPINEPLTPEQPAENFNQSAEAATGPQRSQTTQLEDQDRATDSAPPRRSTHSSQAELRIVNGRAEIANGDSSQDTQEASLSSGLEHPSSPPQSKSQPWSPPEHSAVTNGVIDHTEQPLLPRSQHSPIHTAQEPPADEVIDLVTQDRSTLIGGFAPTPPPRRALFPTQPSAGPHRNSSVSWQSSWPFQTQLPRPVSAATALPGSSSRRPDFNGHRFTQVHPQVSQFSAVTPRASSLPLGQSSPLRNSSPIPTAPSRSGGILPFGESVPPRPNTPSSPLSTPSFARAMSASQSIPNSGKDLKDRLSEMRQRRRNQGKVPRSAPQDTQPQASAPPSTASSVPSPILKRLASPLLLVQDGARSPSAVPALEPLPIITTEEMQTSERYETLLPQAQESGTSEEKQNGSLTTTRTPARRRDTTGDDPESANVHAAPLSLVGHQRDQYPQMIWHERGLIQRMLAMPNPSDEMIAEAKRFVQRMRDIALHPDLDNAETLTQYEVKPSQQAEWDVSCSAKFRFLRQLIDQLRHTELNIAIVAQPGRIMDILETFLQGIEVAYLRPDATSPVGGSEAHGTLTVMPLATDVEPVQTRAVDLVIAMDNSVRHDTSLIRHLRKGQSTWAPFVTLVIPRSVEHVERCLSPTLSDRALTRALVSGVYQFRNEAGKLVDGQHRPKDSATALARYLTSADHDPEWPLSILSPLDDLDSQTQSDTEPSGGSQEAVVATHAGEKRMREPDAEIDATDPSKRARVDASTAEQGPGLPTTINPQEVEMTHISDSIDKTTQSNATDAEASSPTLNSVEKRLQELLIEAQNRLEEHVQALSDLQYRFEEQRNQLVEARNEREAATLTAQTAITRLNEQSTAMSKLRAERTDLKQQVEEANKNLLDHSLPERVELEGLRLTAALANAGKEKSEKRIEQANNDLAYARQMYQESSTIATNHANEISELENELAVAQNRATGEQARLRQMGYDTFTKNLQDENRKLKSMLMNREEGMKFRDEEIARMKEASRGRMGTRGTSVPRSPRIGSPMRSRQGSPAIGDVRGRSGLLHPLRNA